MKKYIICLLTDFPPEKEQALGQSIKAISVKKEYYNYSWKTNVSTSPSTPLNCQSFVSDERSAFF